MFEKSLLDMVKGIRDHKNDEATYISLCIKEIKSELNSTDKDLKADALAKLVYVRPTPPRAFSVCDRPSHPLVFCSSTCAGTTWAGLPSG